MIICTTFNSPSMTSLLDHSVAQPTEYRFQLKKLCLSNSIFDLIYGDFIKLGYKIPKFLGHFSVRKTV